MSFLLPAVILACILSIGAALAAAWSSYQVARLETALFGRIEAVMADGVLELATLRSRCSEILEDAEHRRRVLASRDSRQRQKVSPEDTEPPTREEMKRRVRERFEAQEAARGDS